MDRNTLHLLSAIFAACGAALAQSAAAPTAFDVASVKPSPPSGSGLLNINLGTFNHGVATLTNTTLSECIRFAYGLVSEDQISGPDWIRDRSLRVDIVAKTSPETPFSQALLMMQTLLAQRFHLDLHREPRPIRHFELALGKSAARLHESKDDAPVVNATYRRGLLFYDHMAMHTLAVLLSRQLKQPVIDLTGLSGFYDIHLEWSPDDPAGKEALPDVAPLPDVYHAVEAQLGLQLEPKKTAIDVLAIDRAEKVPIAN